MAHDCMSAAIMRPVACLPDPNHSAVLHSVGLQTKAKCAMLTSLKTMLKRSKNRASLMQKAASRMLKPASETLPKMSQSSFEGSQIVVVKGAAAVAEVPAHQGGTQQAEADHGTGIRPSGKKRAVAKAQQKIKNQAGRRRAARARAGIRVIEIGQSLGHLSAPVGQRLSSVIGMTEIPRRSGSVAEAEVVIGVGAGHDQGLGIGRQEGVEHMLWMFVECVVENGVAQTACAQQSVVGMQAHANSLDYLIPGVVELCFSPPAYRVNQCVLKPPVDCDLGIRARILLE